MHFFFSPWLVEAGPSAVYQQPTMTTTATASTTTGGEEAAFVVESIVRSQGSLSEITIHEGQQFIGEEVAAAGAAAAAVEPQSAAASVSLFGGAVHGSLFEDDFGDDSSDYFCGVRSERETERQRRVLLSCIASSSMYEYSYVCTYMVVVSYSKTSTHFGQNR